MTPSDYTVTPLLLPSPIPSFHPPYPPSLSPSPSLTPSLPLIPLLTLSHSSPLSCDIEHAARLRHKNEHSVLTMGSLCDYKSLLLLTISNRASVEVRTFLRMYVCFARTYGHFVFYSFLYFFFSYFLFFIGLFYEKKNIKTFLADFF